jgi:hypothetical protein
VLWPYACGSRPWSGRCPNPARGPRDENSSRTALPGGENVQ